MSKQIKTYDKQFGIFLGIFLILIIVICFLPYLLTEKSWFPLDVSDPNDIGDTLGGTLGPFVALLASVLTFLAFWVQYKANEQQKRDLQVERFESKFYSMIEIHRNNVNEATIGKSLNGRKAFVSMFNELKYTFYVVQDFYVKSYKNKIDGNTISEEALYNISYMIFFFGVGSNNSPIILDLIEENCKDFFRNIENYVRDRQDFWRSEKVQGKSISVNKPDGIYELKIGYVPCNGHMSKLSHYFRHLFQLVKFVHLADSSIFSYEDKYNYASTIRSQLSSHEQLLLFYNSASVMGNPWLEGTLDRINYLKEYCIVRSIPLPLADFYKRPKDLLGEKNNHNKQMFDWDEIRGRLKPTSASKP